MSVVRDYIGQREWLDNNYTLEEVCTGKGQVSTYNLSSEKSILIKEAGRFCDMYASDILYDITAVDKYLNGLKDTTLEEDDVHVQFIGFREYGVDGEEFIRARCSSANDNQIKSLLRRSIYREVYAWVIVVHPDGGFDSYLCKID